MLEQNYTNQSDKGRFGFSESGTFRSPFKTEAALVALFTVILIAGTAAGIAGGIYFLHTMVADSPPDTDPTFYAITGVMIIFLATVLSFVIFKVGISYAKRGFECTYSATEEVFTANIGGDVHTIRYNEVQSILFEPRTLFGKICGYNVSILIGNRAETYGVAFVGQFQSEKTTPFYIIKERTELIEARRIEEAAKLAELKLGANAPLKASDVEAKRKKSLTPAEKVEALFAKSSEMTAVAPAKPVQSSAQNEREDNSAEETTKEEPTKEEMPEIGVKKNKMN